jgi:hypothetical protein
VEGGWGKIPIRDLGSKTNNYFNKYKNYIDYGFEEIFK